MLLSRYAVIKWNSKIKKHYVDLGYYYTKMGDEVTVDVRDLTKGSTAIISVRCDYCGKEYKTTWQKHLAAKERSLIDKDCCLECCELKAEEAITEKYGGYSEAFRATNHKRITTNVERYGTENVFASDIIKSRIETTCVKKYGVPCTANLKSVVAKRKETCMKKYGVEHYIEIFKGKFIGENSPCWKGGAEYSRVERATNEYIQWRKEVFARDKYTCQCCGDRNGNGHEVQIHAHHILNWNDYPENRYDINNGITLCQKCHMRFHSIYGKHNNNAVQLQDFLKLDKKIC